MYKVQTWLIVVVVMSFLLATGTFAAQEAHQGRRATQALEEQTATPVPTVDLEKHPVILAMAAYFRVPPQEIRDLFDSGVGLGVIARAYVLGPLLDKTPKDIIDMKKSGNTNWGQLKKGVKGTPGARVNLGAIMSGKSTPPPEVTPEPTSAGETTGAQVHKQEPKLEKGPNSEANHELKGSGGDPGSNGDGSGNGHGGGGSDKGHGGSKGEGGKGK
jgi:uncharacterized membrane protein YgcG